MFPLSSSQLRHLKKNLEAREAELQSALSREASCEYCASENGSDPVNTHLAAMESAVAGNLSQQLQEVDQALKRLNTPNFGVCVDCLDAIGIERLTACPSAQRCMHCQEGFESIDASLTHPSI